MRIAVLGANGRSGQAVVREALSRGWSVRGLVRNASAVELQADGYEVVEGDARNRDDVIRLAEGTDAIVSVLGSHSGKLGPLYGQAAEAIAAAAHETGVTRVVVLSTRALGDTAAAGDPPDRKLASNPQVHEDLRAMERVLSAADLELTIMRPARLISEPRGDYDTLAGGVFPLGRETRRADLAAAMLDAVADGLWIGDDVGIVSR